MTVLVLADEADPSADLMVQELRRRDWRVFRFDTAWFPSVADVAARFVAGRWTGELRGPRRLVDIEEITSVWWRSPTAFRLPDSLSHPERQHAHNEAKLGLGGVLLALPAVWLDRPDIVAAACYKPVQLQAAAAAGLAVPDTLVTNRCDAVDGFVRDRATVTKMLGAPALHESGGRRVAWTQLVTADMLDRLDGIRTTAHQFQRWVDKRREVRVVVVDRVQFAVAIDAHSPAARIDWRSDYGHLTYEVIAPSESTARSIDALMARLGLRYGALDFVIDPAGTWWFLEINPVGQYGWLEQLAGIPVTVAIADALTGVRA